ncbi:MAG: insulinase family protein [Bacteroidales bacterium]|jgi:predicted Zn-dependent peptidase|nr:insulinase family protein [Bacteroidales bacterium]
MQKINKKILKNGLTVLHQYDDSTSMVAVNTVYDVGARDEDPDMTGFAHLFEHLMFGGSENIPNFDAPVQQVGGENNAFTNNDITNYYISLPANNIETALWLESDRMLKLAFTPKSLEVQQQVVIEEFNQRYLNQPYGDVWLLLRPLAYREHPYQWATIGKNIEHIENAKLTDVKEFFYKHYAPNNAILSIVGNISENDAFNLAEKWYADIPKRDVKSRELPVEPKQTERRFMEVTRDVPSDAIYMAFHMSGRLDKDYQSCDLISDILSNGRSARLPQRLIKETQKFSEVNAYISGDKDPGLFIVTGKPNSGVELDEAERLLMNELKSLTTDTVDEKELQKVKNKVESGFVYADTSILNRAMNFGMYQLLGDADNVNYEMEKYAAVTPDDLKRVAKQIFTEDNCSVLYYRKNS